MSPVRVQKSEDDLQDSVLPTRDGMSNYRNRQFQVNEWGQVDPSTQSEPSIVQRPRDPDLDRKGHHLYLAPATGHLHLTLPAEALYLACLVTPREEDFPTSSNQGEQRIEVELHLQELTFSQTPGILSVFNIWFLSSSRGLVSPPEIGTSTKIRAPDAKT